MGNTNLIRTLLVVFGTLHVCIAADPVLGSVESPDAAGNTVDSSSTVKFAPLPEGTAYKATAEYDQGAMGPLFNFARSFVNTCFPQQFPFDIIEKLQKGQFNIAEDAQGIVMAHLGYAICVVIGLLFIIIFPLIGCCFCCCRCCGNCGGKMMQKTDPSASCKRKVFGVLFFVMIVMTGVGTACVFVSNDRMTTALLNLGQASEDNIDDMTTFLDNTVTQVQRIAVDNFNFTKDVIFRDLDSLGYLVGIPLRQSIGTTGGVETAMTAALNLQPILDNAISGLQTVLQDLSDFETNLNILSDNLTSVKTDLEKPDACGTPSTNNCPGIDTTQLGVGVDSSQLPNMTGTESQLNSLKNTNITKTVLEARVEYDTIPERVQNDTASTVSTLKSQFDDYAKMVDPMVSMVTNLKSQALGSFDLDSIKIQIKSYTGQAADYNKYRWYAGIGLTSLILLIVMLQLLGLTCGVFGSSARDLPTERGGIANCGGILLIVSVALIFMFSWLLMLLTTLTYMVGAPVERYLCQPLADPELKIVTKLIDELDVLNTGVDGSYLGQMLFQDPNVNITFGGILKDCKEGKAVYTALQMDNFKAFNLTAVTDYKSSLNIDTQINSITVDLSAVTLLTPDMVSQMDSFKTAITDIDFSKFSELDQNSSATDLSALRDAVNTTAENAGNPTMQAALAAVVTKLDAIISGSFADTNTAKASLKASSSQLDTTFNSIPAAIDDVINKFNISQEYIRNDASDLVKTEAKTFATRLTSVVDAFINDSVNGLKTEIGSCTPIYNIYASLLVNGFCHYTIDALNGFWFALGWCLFLFVPSLIFSVKLAKHYRRMQYMDSYDNTVTEKMPGSVPPVNTYDPPPFASNKVGHSDKW